MSKICFSTTEVVFGEQKNMDKPLGGLKRAKNNNTTCSLCNTTLHVKLQTAPSVILILFLHQLFIVNNKKMLKLNIGTYI